MSRGRLSASDLVALRLYAVSRIGVAVVVYCVGHLFVGRRADEHAPGWLSLWRQWDWFHFENIARYGYFGPVPNSSGGSDPNREAFFPGFPLLLRGVHAVVSNWTAAGLLISFVAGAVVVVALGRIAQLGGAASGRNEGDELSRRTVLFFLLSPAAIFLAAGYTEAIFLAFALPAWLAAKHRHWALAGVLCAVATLFRISGLFLVAAIGVELMLASDDPRRWRSVPFLGLPVLVVAGYFWYLHDRTGDWWAWQHAQDRGWYRSFHNPLDTWHVTWSAAFGHEYPTMYSLEWQLEMVAMLVGLGLVGWLAWRRRWPELTYVGLTLAALASGYWYMSIPRATLLWWPLWVGLAGVSLRRAWVHEAYLVAVAPLMVVVAAAFTSGRWAG